ncbi:hypothetical protein LSH36_1426g00012, partial [Paralvinella palmiformis]
SRAKVHDGLCSFTLQSIPDTPESSKSDLHQLVEDVEEQDKPRSSLPMASFNFINSIIGSGIIGKSLPGIGRRLAIVRRQIGNDIPQLRSQYRYIITFWLGTGMPYAMKEAGFGLGILLVLIVTVITDYSLVLLIHGGELSNTNTYQDVMRAAFGRPAMISYNVIIGDTITKIVVRIAGPDIRYTIIGRREFIIAAVTLVVTLPLSLYKNIARLSKVRKILQFVIIGFHCP